MRLIYLNQQDAQHHGSWSGTHRRMLNALSTRFSDMGLATPLRSRWFTVIGWINRIAHRITGQVWIHHHHRLNVWACGAAAQHALNAIGGDVVFAPAASVELLNIKPGLPVIYLSDATPALLDGYYPSYTALPAPSKARMHALERLAIGRSDALIYPSRWAAQSAIDTYGAHAQRVFVQPFGPNFDDIDAYTRRFAARTLQTFSTERPLRVLCVGKDWIRKGAQIAVDAVTQLRMQQYPVSLELCGFDHVLANPPDWLVQTPLIDKSQPDGYLKLAQVYARADVFMFPSQAECAGVVLAEAAAFGLAIIANQTGGIPDMVSEHNNAILINPTDGADAYAHALLPLLQAPDRLLAMQVASVAFYQTRLHWDRFADQVYSIATALLKH